MSLRLPFLILTVLQSAMRLFMILKASITINPATMAFVVAIAGIIFPAMAMCHRCNKVRPVNYTDYTRVSWSGTKSRTNTFDIKPTLLLNAIDMGAKIGSSGNKVQCFSIILIKRDGCLWV